MDDYLAPRGALEGLQRVLRDGKARFAGFICRGNDGEEVRQLLDTGLFHMINVPYTLMNPTAGRARPDGLKTGRDFGAVIEAAQASGVGVAVYSPLAGGFLTDQCISKGEHHAWARAQDASSADYRRNLMMARSLSFLSQPGKHSLAQAAMRFILMHPGVSVVLGGFSDIEQMEHAVPACCEGPLDAQLLAWVENVWTTNFSLN